MDRDGSLKAANREIFHINAVEMDSTNVDVNNQLSLGYSIRI